MYICDIKNPNPKNTISYQSNHWQICLPFQAKSNKHPFCVDVLSSTIACKVNRELHLFAHNSHFFSSQLFHPTTKVPVQDKHRESEPIEATSWSTVCLCIHIYLSQTIIVHYCDAVWQSNLMAMKAPPNHTGSGNMSSKRHLSCWTRRRETTLGTMAPLYY